MTVLVAFLLAILAPCARAQDTCADGLPLLERIADWINAETHPRATLEQLVASEPWIDDYGFGISRLW